eukprot:2496836-Pyramimonas_sp.AAC.1
MAAPMLEASSMMTIAISMAPSASMTSASSRSAVALTSVASFKCAARALVGPLSPRHVEYSNLTTASSTSAVASRVLSRL